MFEAYRPMQVESEGGLSNGQTFGSFLWKTFPCSLGYSTRLTDFHLRFESHMIKLVFWIIFFNSFFCMNDSIEYCWLYWMKKKWMNILDLVLNWLFNWIFFWSHTMIKWIFNSKWISQGYDRAALLWPQKLPKIRFWTKNCEI